MKARTPGRGPDRVQIVSKHRLNEFGTTQLRCFQPAQYLKSMGSNVTLGELYRSIPSDRCVLIIHRALLDEFTAKFIAYAKNVGNVVVYDTDDLLFENEISQHMARIGKASYAKTTGLYRSAMKACDVVLVATDYLRVRASAFHPDVRLMRNGLSREFMQRASGVFEARGAKRTDRLTVAYLSGSDSHDRDFALVDQTLICLLSERDDLQLVVVGPVNISDDLLAFGDRVDVRDFIPYATYADIFREVDINLSPLETDETFCQAKSELKFIEAGACGVPTVASPTPALRSAIRHHVNGVLAENHRWHEEISALLDAPERREKMGVAARQYVLENYSPRVRAAEWRDVVDDVWATYGRRPQHASWHPRRLMMRTGLERFRLQRRAKLIIRSAALRFGIASVVGVRNDR